jgi:hypothetical protein
MVKLEKRALGTPPAIRAHERALPSVALVHLANHRARDVARVQLAPQLPMSDRARLLGCSGLSEPLLHGFVDQQIHRELHDARQVTVRHLMTQQLSELFQLVMQRLSSCKLDFVPTRAQRRRRGALPWRFQRERRQGGTDRWCRDMFFRIALRLGWLCTGRRRWSCED